ncbi:MAG: hypothetical protein ACFCBW_14980 [Candidatus Competibacterales bacterium]
MSSEQSIQELEQAVIAVRKELTKPRELLEELQSRPSADAKLNALAILVAAKHDTEHAQRQIDRWSQLIGDDDL